MKTSDFILSFLIILIFIGLFMINILGIGIKNIQNNWPLYRCNPLFMPFAKMFNHDVEKNFTYCIQNMQKSYMGELLKPIHYSQELVSETTQDITSAIQDIRAFFNKIRNFISEIVSSIMGVFLNLLIDVQKTILTVIDLFGKLIGVSVVSGHLITSSSDFSESLWYGPPGKTLKAVGSVCFHPDTLVKTNNNSIVKMKNLKIGDKLKGDQRVEATMNILNLDLNNKYKEKLYRIENGENNNPIFVSGSHLIYDKDLENFVKVKNYKNSKITEENSEIFVCLITSDHTIPLGNHIFHDWEDNNGSSSKNL